MKIIGIDASLCNTALIIYDEATKKENSICIKTTSKEYELARLAKIFEGIIQYCYGNEICYFMEDLAFNAATQHTSSALVQGGIRIALYYNIKKYPENNLYLVAPTSLKKFLTGKGNAKKEDMKLHVYKRWGKECETNDEADAYSLMMLGRYYLGEFEPTEAQQAVLSKIKVVEI